MISNMSPSGFATQQSDIQTIGVRCGPGTFENHRGVCRPASALTHSDGSGISESFLKIDAADADHWNGFDVLLCALM